MAKPAIDLSLLSPEERLDLIEELWESLSAAQRASIPLTSEQEAELDRRLDDLETDGPVGISPEELRANILRTT